MSGIRASISLKSGKNNVIQSPQLGILARRGHAYANLPIQITCPNKPESRIGLIYRCFFWYLDCALFGIVCACIYLFILCQALTHDLLEWKFRANPIQLGIHCPIFPLVQRRNESFTFIQSSFPAKLVAMCT